MTSIVIKPNDHLLTTSYLKQLRAERLIPTTGQNDPPTKDETIHRNIGQKRLKLPRTGVIFGQVWPSAKNIGE